MEGIAFMVIALAIVISGFPPEKQSVAFFAILGLFFVAIGFAYLIYRLRYWIRGEKPPKYYPGYGIGN